MTDNRTPAMKAMTGTVENVDKLLRAFSSAEGRSFDEEFRLEVIDDLLDQRNAHLIPPQQVTSAAQDGLSPA